MSNSTSNPGCDVCHTVLDETGPDEYLFIDDHHGSGANLCSWPCVVRYAAMRVGEQIAKLEERIEELEAPYEPDYEKPGE